MQKLVIYTDGGARGNPGPAAIGAVVVGPSDKLGAGKEYAEAIGETTNNVAEYKAVIFALKKARHLTGREQAKETEIEINSDSELIVHQLNGKYKVKEDDLKTLFVEVWNLKQDFKKVTFNRIPREENKAADKLVNKLLGRQTLPF
ncbi:MAG: ribonuclease HI family protein [bacterium]|nr:ribonuclease HI family protein [bacterium]